MSLVNGLNRPLDVRLLSDVLASLLQLNPDRSTLVNPASEAVAALRSREQVTVVKLIPEVGVSNVHISSKSRVPVVSQSSHYSGQAQVKSYRLCISSSTTYFLNPKFFLFWGMAPSVIATSAGLPILVGCQVGMHCTRTCQYLEKMEIFN